MHTPSNRLLLGPTAVSKTRLVWVDNTSPGSGSPGWIVRIDTDTGYQTARFDSVLLNINGQPTGAPATGNYPGRVAVDTNGDVWIVNRAYGAGSQGTLSKFSGNLAHCIDRNNNGKIETSSDVNGDHIVDPYKNPNLVPANQVEYYGQDDECILTTIKIGSPGHVPRAIAVDKRGKIWVGTWSGRTVYRFNPNEPVALEDSRTFSVNNPFPFDARFYSAATADDYIYFAANYNWAASGIGRVIRINIENLNQADYVTCSGGGGGSVYGIVAVPGTHQAWAGAYNGTGVWKINFDVNPPTCTWYNVPSQVTAMTLDFNGKIWASGYSSHKVYRLNQNGTIEAECQTGGIRPHGLSVDFDGYIWSVQDGAWNLVRFHPTQTSNNCGRTGPYDIARSNLPVPGGQPTYSYFPYLYSDFTGTQIDRQSPYAYVGGWDATYDAGGDSVPWQKVTWNTEPEGGVPAETSLIVSVRAANTLAALGQAAYTQASNGAILSGVTGRYVQFRAGLKGPGFTTPTLSDITIAGPCDPLGENCCVKDADCNDSNPCSADTCPVAGGKCQHTPIQGCCLVNADCNDGDLCTTDTCSGGSCQYAAVNGCCNSNADCSDGDLCTVDICSGPGGTCTNPLINGCCMTDQDCTKGNLCSNAKCPVPGGFCQGGMIPGCCNTDADCADSDLCTQDTCNQQTLTCANVAVPGCCNYDYECDDNNICTVDTCTAAGGTCAHALLPGCCNPNDPLIGTDCDLPIAPYDHPPCKPGKWACLDGKLECQGAIKPEVEKCNHIDDNCDGTPDSPPPCPSGTLCIDGLCIKQCSGELGVCDDGFTCINNLCMPTTCAEVICPEGEQCVGGLCQSLDGGAGGQGAAGGNSTGGAGGNSSVGGSGQTGGMTTSGVGGAASGGAPATGAGAASPKWGMATGGSCLCSAPGRRGSGSAAGLLALAGLLAAASRRRRRWAR